MNPIIGFATSGDIDYLSNNDHLSKGKVEEKIKRQEYIVAKQGDTHLGFLRFTLFWSEIPCIDMVLVEQEHRRQGIGKSIVKFLEDYAFENGQSVIMSSSQQDEPEPQTWHRQIGFEHAGIINDFAPIQDVPEIIFIKRLQR